MRRRSSVGRRRLSLGFEMLQGGIMVVGGIRFFVCLFL